MNLVLTVLEVVAPVFLLGTLGFAWVKLGFEYRIQFVTHISMTLAVPALIFVSLMQTQIDPVALTTVSIAAVAGYGLITVVTALMVWALGLDRRTYLAPAIFGNTGNIGLPLALFAFGDVGLGYAVVVFAVMSVFAFSFGVWLVSGGGSPLRVVQEPMVAATLLGALFLWQGWQTPTFLTNALTLVGQMAIPLMLITLGVGVARLTPGRLGRSVGLSVAKAVICISSAWAVGLWFALEPVAFAVLVLQISTPVAVTSYLLAEKYGADGEAVAGMVFASTLLSIALIPVLLGFLL
ncbi:MAG: AEC family transporter [Pseudomonadota bacterium]